MTKTETKRANAAAARVAKINATIDRIEKKLANLEPLVRFIGWRDQQLAKSGRHFTAIELRHVLEEAVECVVANGLRARERDRYLQRFAREVLAERCATARRKASR